MTHHGCHHLFPSPRHAWTLAFVLIGGALAGAASCNDDLACGETETHRCNGDTLEQCVDNRWTPLQTCGPPLLCSARVTGCVPDNDGGQATSTGTGQGGAGTATGAGGAGSGGSAGSAGSGGSGGSGSSAGGG